MIGKGQKAVGDDVEPRRLVDLVRVKRVKGASHPGGSQRQSEGPGKVASAEGREQGGEEDRDVVGENGVAGGPDDRSDGE